MLGVSKAGFCEHLQRPTSSREIEDQEFSGLSQKKWGIEVPRAALSWVGTEVDIESRTLPVRFHIDSVVGVFVSGGVISVASILLTALASGLALLLLALASDEQGSEIQAPMAIVILFGLMTPAVLNMFVMSAVMGRFGCVRGLTSTTELAR